MVKLHRGLKNLWTTEMTPNWYKFDILQKIYISRQQVPMLPFPVILYIFMCDIWTHRIPTHTDSDNGLFGLGKKHSSLFMVNMIMADSLKHKSYGDFNAANFDPNVNQCIQTTSKISIKSGHTASKKCLLFISTHHFHFALKKIAISGIFLPSPFFTSLHVSKFADLWLI